jgi:hypothetical protein
MNALTAINTPKPQLQRVLALGALAALGVACVLFTSKVFAARAGPVVAGAVGRHFRRHDEAGPS